jgi:hypothetical protein
VRWCHRVCESTHSASPRSGRRRGIPPRRGDARRRRRLALGRAKPRRDRVVDRPLVPPVTRARETVGVRGNPPAHEWLIRRSGTRRASAVRPPARAGQRRLQSAPRPSSDREAGASGVQRTRRPPIASRRRGPQLGLAVGDEEAAKGLLTKKLEHVTVSVCVETNADRPRESLPGRHLRWCQIGAVSPCFRAWLPPCTYGTVSPCSAAFRSLSLARRCAGDAPQLARHGGPP